MPYRLKNLKISAIATVDDPDNPPAEILLFKRRDTEVDKAKWTAAQMNDFPDSSFAVVLGGGKKDEGGKTVPRSLRKLPYKDASGKVDLPHLRNALARLPQTDLPAAAKASAKAKLEAAARAAGVGDHKKGKDGGTMKLTDLGLSDDQVKDLEKHIAEAVKKATDETKSEADKLAGEKDKEIQTLKDELKKAKEPEKEEDPLEKADPEVRKRLVELEKQNKEANERLAKVEDERRTVEATEIIKGWNKIPGVKADDEELVDAVKAGKASLPGKFNTLVEVLNKANESISGFMAQGPKGEDGEGVVDAQKKVDSMAAKLMEADPKLTLVKARAEVWERNPEMVDQYRKAKGGE